MAPSRSSALPAGPLPLAAVRPWVCSGPLAVAVTATPTSGAVPLTVQFSSNVTGGCPPYEIEWQFGDAGEVTGQNVSHTFQSAGIWDVLTQVSDSGTGFVETNTTIVVNGGSGKLAVAVAANPGSGPAPLTVTFWANASGANLTSGYTTQWQFGDGGSGTGAIVRHVYQSAGSFTAVATLRDSTGNVATGGTVVDVGPSAGGGPANLTLTATPAALDAPGAVSVTAFSHGPGGPYALTVCFGDGSPCAVGPAGWNGTDPVTFAHPYSAAGNYSIQGTLAVTNGTVVAGASATVRVRTGPSLFLETTATPADGVAPLAASFLATISGGTPPYTVRWTFGDGTVGSSVPGVPVTHVYAAPGTYTAAVQVEDAAGHVNTSVLPQIVVRTAGGPWLPASVLGLPTLGVIALLLAATAGVGILVGRWSLRRTRDRQLRKEGEELVRELEEER